MWGFLKHVIHAWLLCQIEICALNTTNISKIHVLNIYKFNLWSMDGVVGTETRLQAGYPRNISLIFGRGKRYMSYSNSPHRLLKLSCFLFSGYLGCVKRPWREANLLYRASAELKNEVVQLHFPICLHGLHRDKLKPSFQMLRVNGKWQK